MREFAMTTGAKDGQFTCLANEAKDVVYRRDLEPEAECNGYSNRAECVLVVARILSSVRISKTKSVAPRCGGLFLLEQQAYQPRRARFIRLAHDKMPRK